MALNNAGSVVAAIAVGVVASALALWFYCLVDFSRTDESQMRTFSKPVWMMLLVFASLLGSLMWLYYGRPQRPSRG